MNENEIKTPEDLEDILNDLDTIDTINNAVALMIDKDYCRLEDLELADKLFDIVLDVSAKVKIGMEAAIRERKDIDYGELSKLGSWTIPEGIVTNLDLENKRCKSFEEIKLDEKKCKTIGGEIPRKEVLSPEELKAYIDGIDKKHKTDFEKMKESVEMLRVVTSKGITHPSDFKRF